MSIPKSLTKLAASVSGRVEEICFRMHGKFMYGFAVVDQHDNELLEIEPIYYLSGDKWLVKNKCTNTVGYRKNLHGFTADIKSMHTGYLFNKGMTKKV